MAKQPSKKRYRLVKALFILCLLITVILCILPIGLRYAAVDWLSKNGAPQASIEDIDINLISGHFSLHGFYANQNEPKLHVEELSISWSWQPLFEKRVLIREINLNRGHVDVIRDQTSIQIGPLTFPLQNENVSTAKTDNEIDSHSEDQQQKDAPWHFGINRIRFNDVVVNYTEGDINSRNHIQQADIGNIASWQPHSKSEFYLELNTNHARLSLLGYAQLFDNQPHIAAKLRLNEFNFEHFPFISQLAQLDQLHGHIELGAEIDTRLGEQNTLIEITKQLKVDHLAVKNSDLSLDNSKLQLKGKIALNIGDDIQFDSDSQLSLTDTSIRLVEQTIKHAGLQWQGQVTSSMPGHTGQNAILPVHLNGDLVSEGLSVFDHKYGIELVKHQKLSINDINTKQSGDLNVASVTLHGLQALIATNEHANNTSATSKPFVDIGELKVDQITAQTSQTLTIDNISIQQSHIQLTISENGEIESFTPFNTPQDEPSEAQQDTATATDVETATTQAPAQDGESAWSFAIKHMAIKGDDNTLRLHDASVQPTVKLALAPYTLELDHLDSTRPHNNSALTFNGKLGQYTQLNVEGELTPLDYAENTALKVKLQDFNLPAVSAYSGKYLGYTLKRGRLNLNSDVIISQNQLDVKNTFRMHRLKLGVKDKDQLESMSEQLAMPLDKALDLLRDGKDRIKLDIPVTGSLDDPQFKLNQIFNRAMGKAIKVATLSYIKNALQPLGTVLFVTNVLTKVTEMRFEPVLFQPGSAVLNEEGHVYLDKIGTLLNERPKMALTLCGVVTESDRQTLIAEERAKQAEQQAQSESKTASSAQETPATASEPTIDRDRLIAIADQRSALIKDRFVNENGIDPQRLFICVSSLDAEVEGQPRVEIAL